MLYGCYCSCGCYSTCCVDGLFVHSIWLYTQQQWTIISASQTTWISPIISKSLAVEQYRRATDHWHCHSEMCQCKLCCYHFIFKNCHNACIKSITIHGNCCKKPEFFITMMHNQNCADIWGSVFPRQPNDHPNLAACAHYKKKMTDTSAWEFLYANWNQNSISCWANNDSWPMQCHESKCTMHKEWQVHQATSQAVPQAHN